MKVFHGKQWTAFLLMIAIGLFPGCGTAKEETPEESGTAQETQVKQETSEPEDTVLQEEGLVQVEDEIFLEETVELAAEEDISQYVNGEVLVGYDDGSYQVIQYADEEALRQGLEELAADENVILIQPNYVYDNSALSVSDPLLSQQWALENDGTFYMAEEKNQYPVYDMPFEEPSAPGQWIPPQFWGMPGGRQPILFHKQSGDGAGHTEVTAQSGIDINLAEAWEVYDGGSRDVIVALIDTGVDYSHEELAESIWVNEGEIPGNGVDDDGNGHADDVYGWNFYDNSSQVYTDAEDDSHGTHGAGTIAAKAGNGMGIAGIVQSDHVKIMVLKALGGSDGSGTTASIIQAIQYAEANGASICNLSLESTVNDKALYQTMANSSMLFVAAAGNDGMDTDVSPVYPAAYDLDNIISVANLNYDGRLHYSSNYGAESVDLAAPGSYILSTVPENEYSYMTGTSMAAPMVTAAAAMVYSYDEELTLADVKEILISSAEPLDTLDGIIVSGGMLDLGAAMTYDHSLLSGEEWNNAEKAYEGSAPEIRAALTNQRGQSYLFVQVTDADGDLAVLSYAAGTLTAEEFQKGTVGSRFSVGASGTAMFTVNGTGTYTFYALDSAGNETVKTVTIMASAGNSQQIRR